MADEKEKAPYLFVEQTSVYKTYHYYLNQSIGSPDQYSEMVHQIMSANANDTVVIHLNTPGGRIDTGVQIINAMRFTQAHVITSLESTAYSLGTIIFLSGDEFVVHDHCSMMFHNYSGAVWGKGHEQQARVEGEAQWINALMREIYYPFLSKEEIEDVIRGNDVWMQTPEIRRRLNKMVRILKKEEKEKKRKSS